MAKICSRCKTSYPNPRGNHFTKLSKSKDGYRYDCKNCEREMNRNWRNKQPREKILEIRKANKELRRKARLEGRYNYSTKDHLARRRELYRLQTQKIKLNKFIDKINWKEDKHESYRDLIIQS